MINQNFLHPQYRNVDSALISALHASPRASVSALASSINEPRSVVSSRLRDLVGSHALRIIGAVNPSFLNLNVIAHVSVATIGSVHDATELARIHPEIVFVSAISGQYDFVMEVRVRTHDELHVLLARFRDAPSVARLSTVIYSRVLRGAVAHQPFEPIEIDAIDRKLIDLLEVNGRATFQHLASAVKLSPSAVRARMHTMLNARVLKIAVIEARGLRGSRLSMGVGFSLGADGTRLSARLAQADYVEFASETVGAFDAIATIAAATPNELLARLDEVRQHQSVVSTTAWTHLRSIKEDYARRA